MEECPSRMASNSAGATCAPEPTTSFQSIPDLLHEEPKSTSRNETETRSNYLEPLVLDKLFDPVHDEHVPIVVDVPDIPRVEPPVLVYGPRGLLLVIVIACKHIIALYLKVKSERSLLSIFIRFFMSFFFGEYRAWRTGSGRTARQECSPEVRCRCRGPWTWLPDLGGSGRRSSSSPPRGPGRRGSAWCSCAQSARMPANKVTHTHISTYIQKPIQLYFNTLTVLSWVIFFIFTD